jgi:peptidoglycan hydrolase-like protein with peptidoglycan-binding domain
MSVLGGSVGRGGVNGAGDARLVQHLLNDSRGRLNQVLLAVDGVAGPKTIAAIELYQRTNALVSDGRVDRNGATIKHLVTGHLTAVSRGVVSFGVPAPQIPKFDPATTSQAFAAYFEALKKA